MTAVFPLSYEVYTTDTDKQRSLLQQIEKFNNNEISEIILKEQDTEEQQTEPNYSKIYGLLDCDTIELNYNTEANALEITIYRNTQCEQSLPENTSYVPILLINDYKITRLV